MAEINFMYEGNNNIIQCNEDEKIEEYIKRFLAKIGSSTSNNFIFLYNGNIINNELKFKEQANEIDKERMKMDILVYKIGSYYRQKIISNDIICPICKENILMNIKDYKINLYECKNNHKKENILP